MSLTIAIDGPAGAGKGTLAQKIAHHYGYSLLDTGLLYRAVGRKAHDLDVEDTPGLVDICLTLGPADLARDDLRGEEVGFLASKIAVIPEVREALLRYQREFADAPNGVVLDGRDIGTTILPHADIKFYITASAEVRAERRFREISERGTKAEFGEILQDIQDRDYRDQNRTESPLKPAEDACVMDTSELSIQDVFDLACGVINEKLSLSS